MANKVKCNICGVPESKWSDGRCTLCGKICDMTPDVVMDQRVYDYAQKKNLLTGNTFSVFHIFQKLHVRRYYFPKYFRDAIAHDGMSFGSLEEFSKNEVLMVCKDSRDGTFQVGMLVWRGEPAPGDLDGINFIYEAACLDAEFCDAALEGAMFESSFRSLSEFQR